MPKSVRELQAQLRITSSPATKKVILKQIRKAKWQEEVEEGDLRHQIRKCRACGLNRTRSNAVPFSGPTRGRADLMVVGEAPGQREDQKGIPFVGQSGKMLDAALNQAGTNRERVFVMNLLCCRPPENRDPRARELEACRPNYEAQLEMGDLMVGVTLGAYALASVIGEKRGKLSMGEYANKPLWVNGRIWVPAYHPAYVLRNRNAFSTLVEAFQLALALRFGSEGRTPLPIPPWDQVEVDGKPGQRIGPVVEKKGYALLHSTTLNQQIVIVKNEGIKVPGSVEHLPRYTLEELMRVELLGRGRKDGWTKQAIRNLNMVKFEFDGEVVLG